jgi:hypothetical protein
VYRLLSEACREILESLADRIAEYAANRATA